MAEQNYSVSVKQNNKKRRTATPAETAHANDRLDGIREAWQGPHVGESVFPRGASADAEERLSTLAGADGATRLRAVSRLQWAQGNAYVARLVQRMRTSTVATASTVVQTQPEAGAEAETETGRTEPVITVDFGTLQLGVIGIELGTLEVYTYHDLLSLMRFGIGQLESALEDIPETASVYTRAQEWISGARAWEPFLRQQGDADIGEAGAAQARLWYREFIQIQEAIARYKRRRTIEELERARAVLDRRQAQIEELRPRLDEQLRRAFLSGDTDTIAEVTNLVSTTLGVGLGLNELSRNMAEAIAEVRGGTIPPASRYTAWLSKFNKVLSGVNFVLNYQDPSAAPTELGEATAALNNLTGAFGTAATLFNLAPHIGLYTSLYLGPMVSAITTQLNAILTEHLHEINTVALALGHAPVMTNEPGGAPMFNFMVPVMHASGPSDVPDVPDAVREYFMNQREAFSTGTEEELPTESYWLFWRQMDMDRIKSWIFFHRRRIWAMLYGSWPIPPPGTRAEQ